jgi:hypothetical protein
MNKVKTIPTYISYTVETKDAGEIIATSCMTTDIPIVKSSKDFLDYVDEELSKKIIKAVVKGLKDKGCDDYNEDNVYVAIKAIIPITSYIDPKID